MSPNGVRRLTVLSIDPLGYMLSVLILSNCKVNHFGKNYLMLMLRLTLLETSRLNQVRDKYLLLVYPFGLPNRL